MVHLRKNWSFSTKELYAVAIFTHNALSRHISQTHAYLEKNIIPDADVYTKLLFCG